MVALKSFALLLAATSTALAQVFFSSDVGPSSIPSAIVSISSSINAGAPSPVVPVVSSGQVIVVTTTIASTTIYPSVPNTDGAIIPTPSVIEPSASTPSVSTPFSLSTTTLTIPGAPWPTSGMTVQTSEQVNSTTVVGILVPVPISSAVGNDTSISANETVSTTHPGHGPVITSVLTTTTALENQTSAIGSATGSTSPSASAGPVNKGGRMPQGASISGLGGLVAVAMAMMGV